jgi:putative DNA primase/helicase
MQGDAAAAALAYARRGWPVFPCRLDNKQPLVKHWPRVASRDEVQIRDWWRRWPRALIGVPTGRSGAGFVVLDIDVKRADQNGFDTLAELGHAVLPDTPMVHTRSGGLHVYFDPGERSIRNTAGAKGRGIGRGLDIRGDGGYVIVPSPGSGYRWDPVYKLDDVPLAPAPAWLGAPVPEPRRAARPVRPSRGLSPYAEAALDGACRRIITAPNGEQEATLNGEAFRIGTLAGAGGLPADFARRTLHWAASQVRNYDSRRPWSPAEIEGKVDRALADGLRRPREVRRG